jgi:phage nucleotide-binding protein
MSIKLISTKDTLEGGVNFLVYGEAGVGKTTLIHTAEKPIIISAEGGLMSLRKYDIPAFAIKSRADCDEIYDWLQMSEEAKQYDTICIDSLSEIAEVLLTDYKQQYKDARQAYGDMNDDMAILIRGFRDLPKNVYFTAKMKKVTDEKSGAIYFIPSVPGNTLLQSLPYFFDEVFAMRFGKLADGTIYRYLQTAGDLQWTAKDRSGTLKLQTEPNIAKIIATINGENENGTSTEKSEHREQ